MHTKQRENFAAISHDKSQYIWVIIHYASSYTACVEFSSSFVHTHTIFFKKMRKSEAEIFPLEASGDFRKQQKKLFLGLRKTTSEPI